jgi:hypothetical protein
LVFIDQRMKGKRQSTIPTIVKQFVLFCINDFFWLFWMPLISVYLTAFKCTEANEYSKTTSTTIGTGTSESRYTLSDINKGISSG